MSVLAGDTVQGLLALVVFALLFYGVVGTMPYGRRVAILAGTCIFMVGWDLAMYFVNGVGLFPDAVTCDAYQCSSIPD